MISLYIDGAEWSGGTEVLAGAATDATAFVDGGYHHGLSVVLVFHHLDSTGGAVASTVAAADAIGQHHAIVFYPNGMAYMDGSLLFLGDGFDGSAGTHLAATGAFGTAVADFER